MTLDAAIAFRIRQSGMDLGPVIDRLIQELANTRLVLIRKISSYGDEIEPTDSTSSSPA